MRAITAVAATDVLTCEVVHGFSAGDRVKVQNLIGGAGLAAGTVYYVIAAGLGEFTFKLSATKGGAAKDITTNLTGGYVYRYVVPGKRMARRSAGN